jgi:hypothetical protein
MPIAIATTISAKWRANFPALRRCAVNVSDSACAAGAAGIGIVVDMAELLNRSAAFR